MSHEQMFRLAAIELKSGDSRARSDLATLEQEPRGKSFNLIARKAASQLR
jgi:hypothetical protein